MKLGVRAQTHIYNMAAASQAPSRRKFARTEVGDLYIQMQVKKYDCSADIVEGKRAGGRGQSRAVRGSKSLRLTAAKHLNEVLRRRAWTAALLKG